MKEKKEKTKKVEIETKKGTISVSFLISMIILVIGFVILLIFYFNLGGTGQMDRTICHQSVIYRATLPSLVENYVPLKCQTNKICITSGKIGDILKQKSCAEYAGEKGITTVKVKSVREIEQIYAQEMLDCWTTMGEGKASLFNQFVPKTFGVGKVYPTCVICSRIAFDNETIKAPSFDLSQMDVAKYMMTHKILGKNISYFEYMASENGKASVKDNLFASSSIPSIKVDDKGQVSASSDPVSNVNINQVSLAQADLISQGNNISLQLKPSAVIFMQITSPSQGGSLLNVFKTIAAGEISSFILAPTLTLKAVASTTRACVSNPITCGLIALGAVAYQQGSTAYNRYVSAGYCGDISMGTEARSGCSAIRTINYDVNDISKYCQVIEGMP